MTPPDCCSRQTARPSFAVEIRPCGQRLILEAHGEIDLATTPRIHEVVAEVVAGGWRQLVIDLRTVSFMDSSGVHLLVDLKDMAEDGVECQMIDGNPEVHRALELCDLTDVLDHLDPADL